MHFLLYLCTRFRNGTLPERLGIGLQNRGRRFESARYLRERAAQESGSFFTLPSTPPQKEGRLVVCEVSV